jgi:hypothetical protein
MEVSWGQTSSSSYSSHSRCLAGICLREFVVTSKMKMLFVVELERRDCVGGGLFRCSIMDAFMYSKLPPP